MLPRYCGTLCGQMARGRLDVRANIKRRQGKVHGQEVRDDMYSWKSDTVSTYRGACESISRSNVLYQA